MTYKLKFNYNGIFRRTSLESLNHESVEKAAREVFAIPDNHKVTLTWVDEEGDVVHVSSEQEFQEFLQSQSTPSIGRSSFANGSAGSLYKFGVVTEKSQPAPCPTALPAEKSGTTPASAQGGPALHRGVACDVCGVCPVVGIRYKCTGRDDYDLCADCEKKADHTFPMLKMYEPKTGVRLQVKGQGFGGPGKCNRRRGGRCGASSDNDSRSSSIPAPAPYDGPVVHEGVTCNECGVGPLVGFRFKCTGRDDYDLCESCEASNPTHPYPMIKIYRPDISVHVQGWGSRGRQCPTNIFGPSGGPFFQAARGGWGNGRGRHGCGRQQADPADPSASMWPRQTEVAETIANVVDSVADVAKTFLEDIDQQILNQTMQVSLEDTKKPADKPPASAAAASTTEAAAANVVPKEESASSPASSFSAGTVKGYALKPMARFVGDITIPDATIVAPSTDFVKIWLVRNDGPCDWPTFGDGVRLVTAGGDPMCDANLSIPVESIKVGNETHISVTLKSPPAPGRYVSYFRLQAADGIVFGQKLWVDIRVQAAPGHVGFTSPAFAVAKQVQVKDANGSESKESSEVPLPVTLATSSATLPFIAPAPASAAEEPEVEMEFPGGEFDEVTPPSTPARAPDVEPAVPLDEDAQWAVEREEMERDWKVELDALRGMGFHNTRENVKLLKKHTKCSFARFPQLQGKPFSDTLSTILDALLH